LVKRGKPLEARRFHGGKESFQRHLGASIKAHREAADISQKELGEAVGYRAKGSISHIENGRIGITLYKIARALGCTLEDLTG
jgi:transcriptional regulator with XRE-family HTH domain